MLQRLRSQVSGGDRHHVGSTGAHFPAFSTSTSQSGWYPRCALDADSRLRSTSPTDSPRRASGRGRTTSAYVIYTSGSTGVAPRESSDACTGGSGQLSDRIACGTSPGFRCNRRTCCWRFARSLQSTCFIPGDLLTATGVAGGNIDDRAGANEVADVIRDVLCKSHALMHTWSDILFRHAGDAGNLATTVDQVGAAAQRRGLKMRVRRRGIAIDARNADTLAAGPR